MKHNKKISRRHFIASASVFTAGSTALGLNLLESCSASDKSSGEVVSITKVVNGNTKKAVEEAIDLLGGPDKVLAGSNSILLKPNLVAPDRAYTTKPEVIESIARIMLRAGKEVMIGEGSAAADSYNFINGETYCTRKKEILDGMQQYVFDQLGYTDLAQSLRIPLINLHSGELEEIPLLNGFLSDSVKIHKKLSEVDLVCSVPMMKTHVLATVSLAMKNLIGLYPGTEYYAMRSKLHDRALEKGSEGVSFEIIDMNQAVKTGLSVIDATMAMEGNGPTAGSLLEMGLIIAGTSPLATDLVGAALMGFEPEEIPYLQLARRLKMEPFGLHQIEVRGCKIADVRKSFVKPQIVTWSGEGIREL